MLVSDDILCKDSETVNVKSSGDAAKCLCANEKIANDSTGLCNRAEALRSLEEEEIKSIGKGQCL